jgi:hypothetical protein
VGCCVGRGRPYSTHAQTRELASGHGSSHRPEEDIGDANLKPSQANNKAMAPVVHWMDRYSLTKAANRVSAGMITPAV